MVLKKVLVSHNKKHKIVETGFGFAKSNTYAFRLSLSCCWPLQCDCVVGAGESSSDDVSARHHVDQWWNKLLTEEDRTCLEHSGKLVLLFDILTLAQQLGDKVWVDCDALPDAVKKVKAV